MPRRRILIVDERIESIAYISKLCGKMQIDCSSAQDGVIAVDEISESMKRDGEAYDAIFMDEVFVWQLFKIRRLGFKGPIIGLTVLGNGKTEPSLPVDEQARFDHILIKPISSKKLLKIIKMIGFVTPLFTFAIANAGAAAAERERIKEKKREERYRNRSKGALIKNSITKPPMKDMVSSGSLDVMLDASGINAFDSIESGFEKINSRASSSSSTSRRSTSKRAITSDASSINSTDRNISPDRNKLKRVASMPNPLNRTNSHSRLTKKASSDAVVVVKKKRNKKKKKGVKLAFNGFRSDSSWDQPFYSQLTMFLSKQEQDELNMHFQRYAEGEERKKDLYEGYIKGILLIGCKSAAKTIIEEMEAERRQKEDGCEDDSMREDDSIYNPDGSLKSEDDESILSIYNDEGNLIDKSNVLSFEQELDFREAFNLFDENGDGSISREELLLAMRSTGIYEHDDFEAHHQTIEDIMQRFDTNRDGWIEYDEFRRVMMAEIMDGVLSDEKEKEITVNFENFDVDGNGYISPSDFFVYMSDLGVELTILEVEQMFRLVDLDGDGQINYREFKGRMYPTLKGQYPELFGKVEVTMDETVASVVAASARW